MSNCKGCGREIVWGISPTGGKIPLETCKHIYMGVHSDLPQAGVPFEVIKCTDAVHFISHFLTCKNASEFSGQGKKHGT